MALGLREDGVAMTVRVLKSVLRVVLESVLVVMFVVLIIASIWLFNQPLDWLFRGYGS